MTHTFVYQSTDSVNDNFACAHCGIALGFNVVGVGSPNATLVDGVWALPEEVLQSVEPCTPTTGITITKRQFLIQLLRSEMVAPEEVAALAYTPPALMQAVLDAMPAELALEARLSWAAMTEVDRYSPLVLGAAEANSISAQTLDDFFAAAAAI